MRTALIGLCLVMTGALAACGGSSGGLPSGQGVNPSLTPGGAGSASLGNPPANAAQAIAQITANWTTFFHTGTDRATAIELLQDGRHLGAAIKAAAKLQRKSHLAEDAKVLNVTFSSPTTATVTYDLLANGKSLLPSGTATGTAVYQSGGWKVSKSTFCTLVELGTGTTPSGCS